MFSKWYILVNYFIEIYDHLKRKGKYYYSNIKFLIILSNEI